LTYEVYLERDVHHSRVALPGNVRQRFRRVIDSLADEPRPGGSTAIELGEIEAPGVEVRRYRLDPWRLVYAINDRERWVWILALRRRPPYDYADLADLVARLPVEPER